MIICVDVATSVGELTDEVKQLYEVDKSNQETVRHYDTELTVF